MGSKRNKAAERTAKLQAQVAQQQLDFARQQFEDDKPRQAALDALLSRVSEADLQAMLENQQFAREDRARFNERVVPIENALFDRARDFNVGLEGERDAAAAEADLADQFGQQRRALNEDLLSTGTVLSPAMLAELNRLSRVSQAADVAGVRTRARLGARDRGTALQTDAISLGRGLPAQALAASQVAGAAGGGAGAAGVNGVTSFRQGGQQFLNGLTAAGNGFAQSANTSIQAFNQRTSRLGGVIKGAAAGFQAGGPYGAAIGGVLGGFDPGAFGGK